MAEQVAVRTHDGSVVRFENTVHVAADDVQVFQRRSGDSQPGDQRAARPIHVQVRRGFRHDGEARAEPFIQRKLTSVRIAHPGLGKRIARITGGFHLFVQKRAVAHGRRLAALPVAGALHVARRLRGRSTAPLRRLHRGQVFHEFADGNGPVDQIDRVRLPFRLIGLQQFRARGARQHERELPGQVDHIAHTGVHSLAEERRGLVCGISCQQHPARLPVIGGCVVESVNGTTA